MRPEAQAGALRGRIAHLLAGGVVLWAFEAGAAGSAPEILYRDMAAEAGIEFTHSNGAEGLKDYRETMGSGACLLDYDGDGRLDLYLVTGIGPNQLFRNRGELRFENVTEAAGVGDCGYGMGAAAGDFDNDGDVDLYVTNLGPNRLYVNQGDGTFEERAGEAGVADSLWGSGAVFFDADRDGLLDLYVVNYVRVARPDTNVCYSEDGALRLYCTPRAYPRAPDTFYHNLGGGRFREAGAEVGLAGEEGRGLGVVSADFDRNGWPDLYVANDLDPNFLFLNRGEGTFEEAGMLSGASHSEDGKEESGMGIAACDYDNDGWIDLFVTNYVDETNSLYHNEGRGLFLDASATAGLGPVSLPYVGWGTYFLDLDLDGWVDLFVANGHTESDAEKVDPGSTWKQRDFLFHNSGGVRFEDVTARLAPVLLEPHSGRGAAFGDLDDDGDTEIVVVNQNEAPLLLACPGKPPGHWIGFRAVGTRSNREAVGARIEVYREGVVAVREVCPGGSYLSANDPRVLFGLGRRVVVDSVVVHWPSGERNAYRGLGADRYHLLVEGG